MKVDRPDSRVAVWLIYGTYLVGAVCVMIAVGWSVRVAYNPTDQVFATLAALPASLVLLDVWTLFTSLVRRKAATPLRIPIKTPIILAAIHGVFWVLCSRWAAFDTLYTLSWVEPEVGHYVIDWSAAPGIIVLATVSTALSVFLGRLVRWVLVSELTSAPAHPDPVVKTETEDVELGTEHIYEAQVLLNNLGYEVKPISGELNEATDRSIRQFQETRGIQPTGKVTAKTMIDLRNQWREHESESSSVLAVSEHAVRRTRSKIARLFRLS